MILNNRNFKNWSASKKTSFLKLPNFIKFIFKFIKLSLKIYFKLHIKLVDLFIETILGFAFYVFCVLYGLFGCNGANCHVSNTLSWVICSLHIWNGCCIMEFVKISSIKRLYTSLFREI